MAIQALSSVTNKGYSNVSFGKRGEKSVKNQSNPHVVSSLKAVPLAALIAMSPLNTTNAKDMMRSERNQNVIELTQSQQDISVPQIKDFVEYKQFPLVNSNVFVGVLKDKNAQGKYTIWADYSDILTEMGDYSYYLHGNVTNFNKVKYNIVDDANTAIGNVEFEQVYVSNEDGINHSGALSNPDVIKYVKDLMSKYDTGITPVNREYTLKMTSSGELKHSSVDTSWIEKAKNSGQAWGSYLGSHTVETSDGNYIVRIFSTDENDDTFEKVSIEKEGGGPRMQVDQFLACNAQFQTNDNDLVDKLGLYQINVSQKYVGAFSICNEELWKFLLDVYQMPDNNNAFEGIDTKYYYNTDSFGKAYGYPEEP